MSLWSQRDREAAQDRRKRSINRRDHSPAPWKEDPYLSSAGDSGPGYYGDEADDRDD